MRKFLNDDYPKNAFTKKRKTLKRMLCGIYLRVGVTDVGKPHMVKIEKPIYYNCKFQIFCSC